MMTITDIVLFFDLDGVLADFENGIKTLFPDYTEKRYQLDKQYKQLVWNTVYQKTKQGYELWYNLNPYPWTRSFWELTSCFKRKILTATGVKEHNINNLIVDQKRRWVREHLDDKVEIICVNHTVDKGKYANNNNNYILIDDREKACAAWEQNGGKAILFTDPVTVYDKLSMLKNRYGGQVDG